MSEVKSGTYSAASIEQIRAATRLKPAQHLGRRNDLRGKTVFTCADREGDSSDCAFSVEEINGERVLGIHISDVCEYVCENSPLYNEARERSGRFDDLLPSEITDDICNLKEGLDRFAVSVYFKITEEGTVTGVRFEESVLRVASCCIFHEMEQFMLAGDTSSVMGLRQKYGPILNSFSLLYDTAAKLYAQRIGRGGAELTDKECRCTFDSDGKMISSVDLAVPDCKAMIRELLVFASYACGNYFYNKKIPVIYCGHRVGEKSETHCGASNIGYLASESEHYSVKYISDLLPAINYSDSPIQNDVCADDKVIKFAHPFKYYSDLVTLQLIKDAIAASFDVNDMNLNKLTKEAAAKAVEATKSEEKSHYRLENILLEAKKVMA